MRNRSCKITLTIICFLLLPLIAGAKGGSPTAVLPEVHYRFGTAIEGQTVRHDFILLNKGSADLTIEKIKTG
jgi:hypothetical protein